MVSYILIVVVVLTTAAIHESAGSCMSNASCNGNGYCQTVPGFSCSSSSCICTNGFGGSHCTMPPLCKPNGTDCGANGDCQANYKPWSCKCKNNYRGSLCQTAPPCKLNGKECGNHGNCTTFITTVPYCSCRDGYSGTLCNNPPICKVNGSECGRYGECDTCHSTTPRCFCNSGYGGPTCTIAPYCTLGGNECQNGGTCDFGSSPFSCDCPTNFCGNLCEIRTSGVSGVHHVTSLILSLVLCVTGSTLMTN